MQIPVQRINGPVLTAGAGGDRAWPSKPSVTQIQQPLAKRKFRFAHAR
jgi:hypothetical protein